jgi:hypothetical protein
MIVCTSDGKGWLLTRCVDAHLSAWALSILDGFANAEPSLVPQVLHNTTCSTLVAAVSVTSATGVVVHIIQTCLTVQGGHTMLGLLFKQPVGARMLGCCSSVL